MSQAQFDIAVKAVQNLPKDGPVKPSQSDQLYFYARYKQATVGDVNTSKPGIWDMTGRYKWSAWDEIKGMSKEQAMKEYVEKLVELLNASEDAACLAQAKEIENAE